MSNQKTTLKNPKISINPEMLKWAIETSGYPEEQLIEKIHKDVVHWRDGSKKPTYPQLEKIGRILERPVILFFYPKPPDEESAKTSLRSIGSQEDIPPKLHFAFRKAKCFQISLEEILQETDGSFDKQKKQLEWIRGNSDANPRDLAEYVRNKLDIDIEKQKKWKSPEEALKGWIHLLANNGVYSFKENFGTDKIAGFCIYDDVFPIIFINTKEQKPNRQIFTLFHELGHLLKRDNYLDIIKLRHDPSRPKGWDKTETFCNKFASEFLLPHGDFDNETKIYSAEKLVQEETLKRFAKRYKVSREAILTRYINDKKISKEAYIKKREEIREYTIRKAKERKGKKGGGDYYATRMSYLSKAYTSLVLGAWESRKINSEQASLSLDISPKLLNKFRERFIGDS